MHAFGFTESALYAEIARCPGFDVFAGKDFIHWLLKHEYLCEHVLTKKKPGDLVIYFDDKTFQHIGLLRSNDRVESKWGKGQLYDHALFEVPSSYGATVKFFPRPSDDVLLKAFICFAKEQGVPFKPRVQ